MLNGPICLFHRQKKVDFVTPEFPLESSKTEGSVSVLISHVVNGKQMGLVQWYRSGESIQSSH